MRVGLGPVFAYEWLVASRRWQMYAIRVAFIGLLLTSIVFVWYKEVAGQAVPPTHRDLARIGVILYYALIGTQLALLLLAAPAYAAGSICLDKVRGALDHLLTTDLSDAEIILGKLAARLVPVLGLVGCSLPVLALGTLLGGIDPEALFGAYLVMVGVAAAGCALALTLSVWGSKTHEVLLATYLVWAVVVLANRIWNLLGEYLPIGLPPAWLEFADPFWLVFAPYLRPGSTSLSDFWAFLGIALMLSVLLLAVAVLRVRAVTIRQTSRPALDRRRFLIRFPVRRRRRRWFGYLLDMNPVLWKEWYFRGRSGWSRRLWLIYGAGAGVCSLVAIIQSFGTPGWAAAGIPAWVNGLQVSIGLLFLSASSVTNLAEERVRGSLDVLLVTPLTTSTIVWGKWWGSYRRVALLAVLPVVVAFALARDTEGWVRATFILGLILMYGAAITSLGLALAAWVPRLGRAVALGVIAYVLVAAGWLLLLVALDGHIVAEGLMVASPFFGVGELTYEVRDGGRPDFSSLVWATGWIIVYALVAVALFLATMATFDRCLGRMSRHRARRLSRPRTPRTDWAGVASRRAPSPQRVRNPDVQIDRA